METKFNVGDPIIYQSKNGKFTEGTVSEIMVSYWIEPNDKNSNGALVNQEQTYKNKQEVIESLGLND